MKKVLLGLFLLPFLAVMAGQRTVEEAAEIAAQFTNQQPRLRMALKSPRKASDLRLAHKSLKNEKDEAAFYVFNQGEENGFVIVSADDRTAEEVLVYSDKGTFDAQKINPAFAWWLNRFTNEISSIGDDEEPANAPAALEATPIEPLLVNQNGKEITWSQEYPYNLSCPMDKRDNTRSYTGCVATATAQVMYKWCWPINGTGQSRYTWRNCLAYDVWGNCKNSFDTILSVDYSATTYEWDLMISSYVNKVVSPKQRNAVATLMYHCGVAAEMEYGGDETGGSGTLTDYMAYGLEHYLGYVYDKYITMWPKYYGTAHDGVPTEYNINVNEFKEMFNQDLEAGRPIIMGGQSSSYGHAFVCDGRDKNNLFHINWGWEGGGNCYTALTSLQPSGEREKFNEGLDAIIGLRPNAKSAVQNTEVTKKNASKILQDGQVLIVREGVRYNMVGQRVQ